MATDFFLKLDTVKGESADSQHCGEIDVETFSWGESNTTSIGSATNGAGAGKVKFDSMAITTRVSSASPYLSRTRKPDNARPCVGEGQPDETTCRQPNH